MTPDTALLVIDPQMTMFDPVDPVNSAEVMLQRLTLLLARVRSASIPVVFIRHCGKVGGPCERGTPGWQLHPSFQPGAGRHSDRQDYPGRVCEHRPWRRIG